MGLLVRAVITGFGLSIGAALYKKVAKQLGLDEPQAATDPTRMATGVAASDPGSSAPSAGVRDVKQN